MYRNKKVSVVIPAYNEEKNIARVINEILEAKLADEVIAVDNNSKDRTAEEIKNTRAKYIKEEKQGYGHAIMKGLKEASGDLIVMIESDGTFLVSDMEKLLLYSDNFEAVFGTRTSRAAIWSGAFMPFSVRLGNLFVAKFLEITHNGPSLSDVGCTYKLVTRNVLQKIIKHFPESSGGSDFSPELMIWIIKSGIKPIEIPVIYRQRVGDSKITGSVFKAAKLGFVMIFLIIRYFFKS